MGCSSSIYSDVVLQVGNTTTMGAKRRSSTATVSSVDALESSIGHFGSLQKRYGHPSYYKVDGYDLGLRYKVKGVLQSYFVGCSRKTGEKITVKEFHLPHYPADDTSIVSEVLFLSKLSHPGLPAFKEMFLTDTSVYVITDYIDQQRLSHCISTLNVTDARNIFKQLAQIVQYCHEKKIILRDLSPSNIVVKKLAAPSAFEVKIADLSMAVEANSKDALADHPLFEWPLVKFSSPEMILSQPYTIASDIWSLGVVLFAMLSRGKLPFEHNLDHILVRDISTAHYDFDCDEVWEDVSERAKSLVEQMLKVPINERPTAKECLKNHWVVIGE